MMAVHHRRDPIRIGQIQFRPGIREDLRALHAAFAGGEHQRREIHRSGSHFSRGSAVVCRSHFTTVDMAFTSAPAAIRAR